MAIKPINTNHVKKSDKTKNSHKTNTQSLKELKDLRNKLKKGDPTRIKEIVGCGISMVKYVLAGERSMHSPKGKAIIKVAKAIVEQREELKEEIQNQ